MRKRKQWMSLLLTAILAVSLMAGCGSVSSVETDIDSELTKYAETVYDLPGEEDATYSYAQTIRQLDDGTLRAFVCNYTDVAQYAIYDSADGGETWEVSALDDSALQELLFDESYEEESGSSCDLSSAVFDGAGDLFVVYTASSYYTEGDVKYVDEETAYYLLTSDGVLTEIDVEIPGIRKSSHYEYDVNSGEEISSEEEEEDDGVVVSSGDSEDEENYFNGIYGAVLQNADSLYVYDYDDTIYHISISDGSVIATIAPETWVYEVVLCGDSLLVMGGDLYEYDTETDELLTTHTDVYDIYCETNGFNMVDYNEEGILYFACSAGIYSYELESQTMEKLVDATYLSINSTQIYIYGLFVKEDGQYLVWYVDYLSTGVATLVNISYDEEAAASYEAELTVYVLTSESEYVMQTLASIYQKTNTKIKVNVECGLEGDDAVTTSDALRTLNTEILAGEGPDIIIMDGIDADAYVENGLLADISDVIQPLIDDGEVFGNIVSAYATDAGEIYVAPTGFAIPALVSTESLLAQIESLEDLADLAEAYGADGVDFIRWYSLIELPIILSYTSATDWIDADGTLNEESLATYLSVVQRIYRAQYDNLTEEEKESVEESIEYYIENIEILGANTYVSDPSDSVTDILWDICELGIGSFCWADSLEYITSAQREDATISYAQLPGDADNVFVAYNCVAINSGSQNMDAAKEFVAFLFSQEASTAMINWTECYPINVASYEEWMTNPYLELEGYDAETTSCGAVGTEDDAGNEVWMELYWPSEDDVAEFQMVLESLTTPAYDNAEVLQTVWLECYTCMLDMSTSVDDAVAQIINNLSLYLAE